MSQNRFPRHHVNEDEVPRPKTPSTDKEENDGIAFATRNRSPAAEPLGLATEDPATDVCSPPARRIACERSGGARPGRGKQALRLHAWRAARCLSTSAIGTNDEHDRRSAEPCERNAEVNPDETVCHAGDHAGKSMTNRVAPGQGHQRRLRGRCRFPQDRSCGKIRPNPDGSSIPRRGCATTEAGEAAAVRTCDASRMLKNATTERRGEPSP